MHMIASGKWLQTVAFAQKVLSDKTHEEKCSVRQVKHVKWQELAVHKLLLFVSLLIFITCGYQHFHFGLSSKINIPQYPWIL